MSTNQRNEFFTALLAGAMANPSLSNDDKNANDVIRQLWTLADMAVYHSGRGETPEEMAQRWIKKNYAIVDTETTGLGSDAQIVEIAIIDCTGKVLVNTLIKPSISIPAQATAIHGITDEMVCDAPSWLEVIPSVVEAIGDCWIAYNAEFDRRIIDQASKGLVSDTTSLCAMRLYAEYNGVWDAYRRQYKWKKLVEAATALNAKPEASGDDVPHRALYDCRLALGVIRAIAGVEL